MHYQFADHHKREIKHAIIVIELATFCANAVIAFVTKNTVIHGTIKTIGTVVRQGHTDSNMKIGITEIIVVLGTVVKVEKVTEMWEEMNSKEDMKVTPQEVTKDQTLAIDIGHLPLECASGSEMQHQLEWLKLYHISSHFWHFCHYLGALSESHIPTQ